MRYFIVVVTFCLCHFCAFASSSHNSCNLFSVGPETFHFTRVRDGGTHQEGWMTGVRVGFDRIKRYKVYIGGDFLYAEGSIKGHTITNRTIYSQVTDSIIEVRIGYTLKQCRPKSYFIVPYVGYGHFKEENQFFAPSPLLVTFNDSFNYYAAGFLSGVNITPLLSMGLNFKLRFMQDGTSKVSDDPIFDTVELSMQDELHVRVEMPFLLTTCRSRPGPGFLIAPFFEYRHFGGREGFPFNFRNTQFYLYGARFALTLQF